MTTGNAAIKRLEEAFPEIAEEIHEETIEGLLHCQIAEFSRFAQRQIDSQNRDSFGAICRVFIELFGNADPTLENALNVSFLEHLDFTDGKHSRSWGYMFMPFTMRKAFDDMEAYNRKIHAR